MKVDFDALYVAIETQIQAAFPDLVTVEFDREDRTGVDAPACLLQLTEMEKCDDPDPGTEQLAMTVRFEAHLILGFRTPKVKREARKLAAAVAHFLHLKRWDGVRTGPGNVEGCYCDDFTPELDQYECWKVEWTHIVHIGDSVWTNNDAIPTRVFVGFAPNIGTGHEADYVELT